MTKSADRVHGSSKVIISNKNEVAAGQTVPRFRLHIVPLYKVNSVVLRFGHGNIPEKIADLQRMASLVRSGLRPGGI